MTRMRKVVVTSLGAAAIGVLILTSVSAQAASPGWITSCNYTHSAPDDPIVFPGVAGAAHLHDFIGGKTTDAFSTLASMTAGGTACDMPDDRSGYWAPALYKDGMRVLPKATSKNALLYYRRGSMKAGVTIQTIPEGLKMIVGNHHAESPAENEGIAKGRISFKCGPGSGTNLPAPPAQCDSGVMVVMYMFPSCWDGARLDSADHKSHMAYPSSGNCPASHPVPIPRVEAFIRYLVGTQPIGTVTMSSGPYYSAHMDFWNIWKPAPLKLLVDNCINAGRDCGKNPPLTF
jgi:hypothetical protein